MMKIFRNLMLMSVLFIISIFGISYANAECKSIVMEDIIVKDKSGTITIDNPTFTDEEIISEIKFNEIGDFVTFELILKNNESEKFKINSITDNNINDNIEIEYNYDDDYILKNDTTKVIIKLIFKNKLVNQDSISLNDLSISIGFEKEDGTRSKVVINPKTKDSILLYIFLFIVSCLGLFLILKKKKIKGIKVGNILILVSILLIPFMVIANKKYQISIKFKDIEVMGEFETYNVTINTDDGNVPITREVMYGQPIGELPKTEKEGYKFSRWEDTDGNEITAESIITKSIEAKAKYEPIVYTISYDLGIGSLPSQIINPKTYTIESNDIKLNNPTKKGYTFAGWTGSNGETLQTSITIYKGTTGNKTFKAHYSTNQDTKYTVIHRYQNVDLTTYEEVIEEEHGATDTEVVAPQRPKTGFRTPSFQTVIITAEEESIVTYTYERELYSFSITDRTYVDSISSSDGNYAYQAEITVKAKTRDGYTFKWNDGITDFERTFNISDNTILTPIYTPRNDTSYKVIHKKQKLDLSGYEESDIQNLTGTTDILIEPAVNTYVGFISPSTQSTTIEGNGSTVITYYYDREMYNLSFNNNLYVTSTKEAGSYPYETEVTITANERAGFEFSKWSNNVTSNSYTFIMLDDITIEPVYIASVPYRMASKNNTSATSSFWGSPIKAREVKSIRFVQKSEVPSEYTGSYDISLAANSGDVMMYYVENGKTEDATPITLYDVYVASANGITKVNTAYRMFESLTNCEYMDLEGLNTSNITNMNNMFYNDVKVKTIKLSTWDTSKVTTMAWMFYNCNHLEELDVSKFNTSRVSNFSRVFALCEKLKVIDVSHFDTSNATNMEWMFRNCKLVEKLDVSKFNTSKVTTMSGMFSVCSKIKELDLSSFNTAKVVDMTGMFSSCSSLTEIDVSSFNTEKVTKMGQMFEGCKISSLDLSNFNTQKVTTMYMMFRDCPNLEELDLKNFETPVLTDMRYMLTNSKKLKKLDISNFDMSGVTSGFLTFSSVPSTIEVIVNDCTQYNKFVNLFGNKANLHTLNNDICTV